MDRMWKCILYLVVLEIAVLVFYISLLSSGSMEYFSIRKREKMSVDIEWKNNNTNVETNNYKNGYKNRNHSFFMTHFIKDQSVETKISHKIQTHNRNQRREVTRKQRVKSKISTLFSYKRVSNKTSEVDTPDIKPENKSMCTFSFDKESLLEARKKLTKPYYLFYINLTINNIDSLTIDTKEQDNLMQWQYVKKSEEFLVQLPVDFDLLTYNLLVIDKEETVLNIPVDYNHSTCYQEKQEQRVSSIRLSLWNELFENNTNFSLCNRDFNSSHRREFLYSIATIWVGYDLTCSMISSEGGFMNYSIEKDHLPLVTPFFCFFLSLQFVWIFALLDLKTDFDSDSSTNDSNENEIKIDPCSVHFRTYQEWFYNEQDRPYGIKRFVVKILYGKCTCKYCGSECTCKSCQIDIQPGLRLLCLLWFFILLPFGLYRTIGRKNVLGHMYNNYLKVVRPSEPMFESFCNNAKNQDGCNYTLDIVYATVFPFIYIIFGYISYKIFLTNHFKTCCCFPEIDEDDGVIRKSKSVSDRFAYRYYQLCNILSTGCCNLDKLECDCYNCCKDNCCDCCACDSCKGNCCNNCCGCFVLFSTFILSLIYCLLPIIPFTFCTHIAYCYCPLCKPCGLKSNNGKKNGYQKIQEVAPITDNSINSSMQSEGADTEKKTNRTVFSKCWCICWVLQVFRIPVTYLFFLRPIISTFTFLFRSFTYFFFVALPIRAHILRYTMLIVTTVAYFAKYFHEIINMNTEILKYLIICQEKKIKTAHASEHSQKSKSENRQESKSENSKESESENSQESKSEYSGESKRESRQESESENSQESKSEHSGESKRESRQESESEISKESESENSQKGKSGHSEESKRDNSKGSQSENSTESESENSKGSEIKNSQESKREHSKGNEVENSKGSESENRQESKSEHCKGSESENSQESKREHSQEGKSDNRQESKSENTQESKSEHSRENKSEHSKESKSENRQENKNENRLKSKIEQSKKSKRENSKSKESEMSKGSERRSSQESKSEHSQGNKSEHSKESESGSIQEFESENSKESESENSQKSKIEYSRESKSEHGKGNESRHSMGGESGSIQESIREHSKESKNKPRKGSESGNSISSGSENRTGSKSEHSQESKSGHSQESKSEHSKENENERSKENKAKKLDEEIFDYVYLRLMFVRKNVYFMFMKMLVVFMYLIITIETFVTNKSSLTGSSFKDILEFLLIIIGPYAISLFLKVNKEDFLTDENKTEIENIFDKYDEKRNKKRNSSSQDQVADQTKICPSFSFIYFVLIDKKKHEMQTA